MAYALLPQITTQIDTLSSTTSPHSLCFDQPCHTLKLREDLEALQRMVQGIQAVLTDAERREIHEESVKLWLRELSRLAYDADDVLDEYNYEVLRAKVEAGIASRPSLRKWKHRLKVSILTMASSSSSSSTWSKLEDRMGKIRLRFEEISHQREALQLKEGTVRARQNAAVRSPSSHLPDTPTIFGREEIEEEVISMLLSTDRGQNHALSVLPIVGMGGVGKTTLVQHVYNHHRVCEHFKLRGWVCVSDDFEVVNLSRKIIESLTRNTCPLNELSAIQSELIQLLKRDRFLVVLDDVWNETALLWDSLLKPFRSAGVEGSAVVVTTRIESIARMVETMPFLRLGCLSDDDCWLIFEENAFTGQDSADHMDLVQIGKKIVEKCKGLPLAVKVLGSLLRNEFDRDSWEDILQSEVWDVPDQYDEIIPALRMSYLHLPSYLKPCFLYASVFTKDEKFRKEQLVQLWMAQGFLQCEGRKQMEDIGNMYFDDLMQRSLFSPTCASNVYIVQDFDDMCFDDSKGRSLLSPGIRGETECYVMHDLIHDLAQHILQGEISSCVGKEKVRHLYRSHEGIEGIESMVQSLCSDESRGIRSLLVVPPGGWKDVHNELKLRSEMVPNLESLRALDLSYFGKIRGLSDSMGYMRHLRYLNLEKNEDISSLPESICLLYNLQLLNLNQCLNVTGLPEGIGDLCNLRYLNLSLCLKIRSLPASIRGLGNLRYLILGSCSSLESLPQCIGGLCNLRDLNLNGCTSLWSLPESIGGLCNLRCLNLHSCMSLCSLPESIGGLCNLQCLEIKNINLSYPRGLSRLTNLRSLVGFTVASRRSGSGEVHGMELLKDMVHLRKRLKIYGLANVVNPEDAVTANLRNKEHIRELLLNWSPSNGDDDDGEKAYRVLESLRPPNGLEQLVIHDYSGVRFPSWIMGGDASSFSLLTRVLFLNCRHCTLLPPLGQLPLLKYLEIKHAMAVERVGLEFRGVGFPALEELYFDDMSSWVTWDAAERGDFPLLRNLYVQRCPKLQSMVPVYLFPSLQELQIKDCGSLLSIELKMPSSSSSSSSSSIGPPPLMRMTISRCSLARFSPEDEPLLLLPTLQYFSWRGENGDNDDGEKAYHVLENLRPPNGLVQLVIENYSGVRFPSWMGGDASSFSRLTCVVLENCIRCTLLPPLGHLPSLRYLKIKHAMAVERVGPEFWGVGFPALEELYFDDMSSWVMWDAAQRGDFPRLRQLRVKLCPKLQSMVPLYLFPSLQQLQITECGSLLSIELKMPSSSSASPIGPPPLVEMSISGCPLARFSPEDEPLLLPATLRSFIISDGCPLLYEWSRRDDSRRSLAHIARVDIRELDSADLGPLCWLNCFFHSGGAQVR